MVRPALPDIDVTASPARRMAWVAAVAFVVAGLIVLGTTAQHYMEYTMREGAEVNFWRVARWPAIYWGLWAVLTPFFFELVWRWPLARTAWKRPFLVLLLGSIGFFMIDVTLQVAVMYLPPFRMIHDDLADAVEYHLIQSFYLNVFIYWCIVGSAHALRKYTEAQRRALRAAQLESELAQARLSALKMQLHPHFLFNTLHGISTLMYRDVATADRMVMRLSGLLRRTLDRSDAHEVTLREEIDFLEEYLAIEQLRFGEGLQVVFEVDEALDDVLVPSFALQPLVENALKHGIAPRGHTGTIRVGARTERERLWLFVEDDGAGMTPNALPATAAHHGIGLSNLQARLRRLYGDGFAVTLHAVRPHGVRVALSVPLRHSSPAAAVRPGRVPVVPSPLG